MSDFWEIVDANWSQDEQNALARLWKAVEDATLSAWTLLSD